MAEEEKNFFVGINNHSEIRRELLECSKGIVHVLKEYDKVNDLRTEKIKKVVELKSVLGEIKRLNLILKEKMPSEKIRAASLAKRKLNPKKKVKRDIVYAPQKDNEIRQLEDELNEIEQRLSKMGA